MPTAASLDSPTGATVDTSGKIYIAGGAVVKGGIDATGGFMEAHEWKGEPLYREWLIPADELNARVPLGRIPSDEEVAGSIVYLASDLSSAMTGQAVDTNGGEIFT